jgi:hypothetical protein
MMIGRRGVFQDGPEIPNRPKWPSRLDGFKIGFLLRLRAYFQKTNVFDVFCENSAVRRDSRSPGTLF